MERYGSDASFMVWLNSTRFTNSYEEGDKILALKSPDMEGAIREVRRMLRGYLGKNVHRAYLFEIAGEGDGPIEDNIWRVCKSINPETGKALDFTDCIIMAADDSLDPDYLHDTYDAPRVYDPEDVEILELYSPDGEITWWIYVFPDYVYGEEDEDEVEEED